MPDMQWWREARFGMFIHWGIYAVAAGRWKGEFIPSLGEWIMYNARIPVEEYERLAGRFNPVEFDAEQWVSLAERAGMKYLVITAKHHDGFAMFDSPCSEYDIVDATPYGHDVMADLARHRHLPAGRPPVPDHRPGRPRRGVGLHARGGAARAGGLRRRQRPKTAGGAA